MPVPTLLLPSLLSSLRTSHRAAYALDSRPGLKFLLQKVYSSKCFNVMVLFPLQVAQIQAAGNLYQQSAAAWSLRVLALYDLAAEKAEGGGAEIQGVVHR